MVNKEQRKFKKTIKRRQQRKNFVKKRNILKAWLIENKERKRKGLPLKRIPVNFPKKRKVVEKKIKKLKKQKNE